jgi:uncharacterized membrane protein
MKARYSVEAFAFAMVVFATNLETALVAGAILVFGTLLGDLLAAKAGKVAGAVVSFVVTAALIAFGLTYAGLASGEYVEACLAGLLVGKHVYDGIEEAEGDSLKENYTALAILAVVAILREVLTKGAILGDDVVSGDFIASAYGKMHFGLIFAGIGIAAINALTKKSVQADLLWVAIPVAVLYVLGASKPVAGIVAAAIAVVLSVGTRSKLVYSSTGKYFASLPVEVISLGFLFMMVSVIA